MYFLFLSPYSKVKKINSRKLTCEKDLKDKAEKERKKWKMRQGLCIITKETAQEIVEEIGREIGAHINLMDEHGKIIASTDASRIGNPHEGAKKIIQEGLGELYITREMENATTKQGINLPLVVDGKMTGVVGITGDREKVYGYGNIIGE